MKENETLMRFVSEIEANIKEIEENVLLQISKNLSYLEKEEVNIYRDAIVIALGKALHDFYDAIECLIFERIVEETGEGKPKSAAYYRILLKNMTLSIKGLRPLVISTETFKRLEEYLRFRHVFRHTYGYVLEEEKIIPLTKGAKGIFERLKEEVFNFCKEIKEIKEEV